MGVSERGFFSGKGYSREEKLQVQRLRELEGSQEEWEHSL